MTDEQIVKYRKMVKERLDYWDQDPVALALEETCRSITALQETLKTKEYEIAALIKRSMELEPPDHEGPDVWGCGDPDCRGQCGFVAGEAGGHPPNAD